MKTVFLIRHAKSSWANSNLDDFDRPLNHRGNADAPRMSDFLADMGVKPQMVLCSTAKRAKQTYAHFLNHFKGLPIHLTNALYHASAQTILEQLHALPTPINTVALFCHNPGIDELVMEIDNKLTHIPTCGVVEIVFEDSDWRSINTGQSFIKSHYFPKEIA